MADPESNRSATPRWVKVSLIIVAVLALAFVALRVAGFGAGHGPGRHLPGGAGGTPTPALREHGGHGPSPGMHYGGEP